MNAGTLYATILRHDRKTASYKIALIRSLNDLALDYAHLGEMGMALAVPLRSLATFWGAYYTICYPAFFCYTSHIASMSFG